jgi:outer membrane lipoprotein-sorting protein
MAAAAGERGRRFANPRIGDHFPEMFRRNLLSLLALPLLAEPVAALAQAAAFQPDARDAADLKRIEAYLNGLQTLKAHFLQVAPSGAVSEGTVWLERPGRMRFQYDPPSPFLLVAGHGMLIFHDSKLDQTTNIPIGQTPLGILLADNVVLSGDVTVTGMQHLPGQIQVSMVRTGRAADGTLTLVFSDDPLALKQWTVVDAQRQETRVTLYNAQLGGSYDAKLFDFVDPRFFQPHDSGG